MLRNSLGKGKGESYSPFPCFYPLVCWLYERDRCDSSETVSRTRARSVRRGHANRTSKPMRFLALIIGVLYAMGVFILIGMTLWKTVQAMLS